MFVSSSQLFDGVQSVHPSGQEPLLRVLQQLLFGRLASNLLFVCRNGTINNPIDELNTFLVQRRKQFFRIGEINRRKRFVAHDAISLDTKQVLWLLDAMNAG